VNDNDLLAVEEAAARLESSGPYGGNDWTSLHSAVAGAVTHGKTIRDIAAAAHLTVLEVLDATDAAAYFRPILQS
jgi:hypothetical protein